MPRIANDSTVRLNELVGKHIAELLTDASSNVVCHVEMMFIRVKARIMQHWGKKIGVAVKVAGR